MTEHNPVALLIRDRFAVGRAEQGGIVPIEQPAIAEEGDDGDCSTTTGCEESRGRLGFVCGRGHCREVVHRGTPGSLWELMGDFNGMSR